MDTNIFFNLKKIFSPFIPGCLDIGLHIAYWRSDSFLTIVIKHTCTQMEIHLKWIPDFTPEIAKNRGKRV